MFWELDGVSFILTKIIHNFGFVTLPLSYPLCQDIFYSKYLSIPAAAGLKIQAPIRFTLRTRRVPITSFNRSSTVHSILQASSNFRTHELPESDFHFGRAFAVRQNERSPCRQPASYSQKLANWVLHRGIHRARGTDPLLGKGSRNGPVGPDANLQDTRGLPSERPKRSPPATSPANHPATGHRPRAARPICPCLTKSLTQITCNSPDFLPLALFIQLVPPQFYEHPRTPPPCPGSLGLHRRSCSATPISSVSCHE